MSSFKSNENIHKKEDWSYYVVSANKASSVTLSWPGNESRFQIIKKPVWNMSLNQSFISDFSEYSRWSQRTKNKILTALWLLYGETF